MDCTNCVTGTDYLVNFAAEIARWLLMAASATAVGIRVFEWRQRRRRSE